MSSLDASERPERPTALGGGLSTQSEHRPQPDALPLPVPLHGESVARTRIAAAALLLWVAGIDYQGG
jgi:hypothetical protein